MQAAAGATITNATNTIVAAASDTTTTKVQCTYSQELTTTYADSWHLNFDTYLDSYFSFHSFCVVNLYSRNHVLSFLDSASLKQI